MISFQALEVDELVEIRSLAERATFELGQPQGIGLGLQGEKRNQQVPAEDSLQNEITSSIRLALARNEEFMAYASPTRWARVRLAKYGVGDRYDTHIDNPYLYNGGKRVRTDISFTIFLSNPESYDGGELCIENSNRVYKHKPLAGTAIAYSTSNAHWVSEVVQGERLVCVGWVQSLFRSPIDRRIVADLRKLSAPVAEDREIMLERIIADLTRRWGD